LIVDQGTVWSEKLQTLQVKKKKDMNAVGCDINNSCLLTVPVS